MVSDRIRRRLDALLDEADAAVTRGDWSAVAEKARAVIAIEPGSLDAQAFLDMAAANDGLSPEAVDAAPGPDHPTPGIAPGLPDSFAAGRYRVKWLLDDRGTARVYLAHDVVQERDVALTLLHTDGLDAAAHNRIIQDAQFIARWDPHPNVLTVLDAGETDGQPYIVTETTNGGDLERSMERAGEALPALQATALAAGIARGLQFAHDHGVAHGDLKPASVWLTVDGVPRLGDFGLTAAHRRVHPMGRDAVTRSVAYLAPEQTLGGEATQSSDLYSLGAMLYELVTARPPFQGSSVTAVVSQHLNASPVAPSWLTQHCPPALEDLILRLLEKDPAARPASASEVLQMLAAVDHGAPSRAHAGTHANPLDRLARGVFVGRERELEQLRDGLDAALDGRGSIIMLAGEPGIGKTRTVQELETYARMRGADVYWGRAYESTGMPPYWPWVQTGNAWASAMRLLRAGPGPLHVGATRIAELSRLFPALRQLPGFVEPDQADSEAGQFRLFDAFAQVMRIDSVNHPAVVVLDDLQWADRPTLDLLAFLAGELGGMRVLVVGTYRDTELRRTHPLSATLAELGRISTFKRLVLRGLTRGEVATYVRERSSMDLASTAVDRIFAETEGNPFFLGEVMNLLVEEGALGDPSVSGIALPDGVRDTLGRRLNRMSPEANELLELAAVIGREFSLETLALLDDRGTDTLLQLIDEPLRARIIEEGAAPGTYIFTHALMRQTILEELPTARRLRMHGAIAEAIERHGHGGNPQYIALLAHHYFEAAALTPALGAAAARYCRRAAEQAAQSLAWQEAVRHYEHSLSFGVHSEALRRDAELHRALGRAAKCAAEWRTAWTSLLRATELFKDADNAVEAAKTTLLLVNFPSPTQSRVRLIDAALEALGVDGDPQLTLKLLGYRLRLDGLEAMADDPHERRFNELRKAHSFPDVDALAVALEMDRALHTSRLASTIMLSTSAFQRLRALNDIEGAAAALHARSVAAGQLGRLDVAKAYLDEQLQFARAVHLRQEIGHSLQGLAGLHFARCDFEAMDAALAEIPPENFVRTLYAAARAEQSGDLERALALLPPARAAGDVPGYQIILSGVRARVFFNAGRDEEARAELAIWRTANDSAVGSLGNGMTAIEGSVGLVDECLVVLGSDETVAHAYELTTVRAADAQPRRAIEFRGLDHVRGRLAMRLGLLDEAAEHFTTGLEWGRAERCPVSAARCQQGLAEIASARGDQQAASQHFDAAVAAFEQHGASLYLAQLAARREEAGVRVAPVHPSYPGGLSEREVEVLRLVAVGRSNQQIADALVIAPATVARHVSNILSKTGLTNRTEAAAYALRHALLA